ncbi:MAG: radical SAM protein, partial [Dehalococcoidia bacterium]|nr:radical SAM protein [Dehalococcoidia bacterium]
MRICLVAPAWQQLVNSYPPLGLAYVAARVEAAGHQVCIEDFNLAPHRSHEEQLERIAESRPDLVGITCMSHVYHGARLLAQGIKSRLGCAVVVGGPHPSIFKETLLEEQSIDFVVYGEGEETLLELSKCLEGGRTPEDVAGLCWRREGEAVRNPPRVALKELDALPFPARHLLRLQDYPLRAPDGTPMATLITSRGCPYDCSFCFKGLFGRTYRQRSVANVIHEIAELTRAYQIRNFYFVDDLFTLNQEWLHDFSQAIVGADLNIRWKCLARVDRVNPHILQQMWQAGCREVHYGIESGNDTILRSITKNVSLSQVREAVSWTRQAGMLVKGYFMLGLPGDTEETILSTVDFASSLELDEAMFSLTTPFPGTRLWQDLVRERPE